MSNRITSEATNWAASAVRDAIAKAERTKRSVSDQTGIPYATLNRKLSGFSEFSLAELLMLAEALEVHPSQFVPPAFRTHVDAA